MMNRKRLHQWLLPLAAVLLLATCGKTDPPTADALLAMPAAPASYTALQLQEVVEKPQNMYRQYARGLLARTAYTAHAETPFHVEIWDLLIGPGMATDTLSLPGATVLEVRSGSGLIVIDGKQDELQLGSSLAVDEGRTFQIDNSRGDQPISLRAVVIRTRN